MVAGRGKAGPSDRRTATAISFAGIAVPFALGLLIAGPVHAMAGGGVNRVGFALFMAVALSITAIPTLGRIMMEFNLNRTWIGCLTITAAGTDDVVGWTLLAVVSGYVRSGLAAARIAIMLCQIISFALVMIVIARPWIQRYVRWELARNQGGLSLGALAITLVMLFLAADVTNLIGISPVFGAFLLGAILSSVRIPAKANADSEGNANGIPGRRRKVSERSDAGISIVQEVFVFVKRNLSGAQRRTRPQAEKGVRGKGRQPFSLPSFGENPASVSSTVARCHAFCASSRHAFRCDGRCEPVDPECRRRR